MIIKRSMLYGVLIAIILLFFFYYFFYQTPSNFKPDSTIRIENGQSLISLSHYLKDEGIVSSSFWLTNLVILLGGEHRVVAGYYFFAEPENLFKVARRITHGQFGIVPVKVTIPEGLNNREIAAIYSSKFNFFASSTFLSLAKDKEGYLFPETYFFVPLALPEDVVSMMRNTFDQKVAPLEQSIATSSHSLGEIVTMASILEGEARKTEDRKIIADILWRRISAGIPLQVDSTLKYITGKDSAALTLKDLKIDSPYNTYLYRGLPPTPISNPGLDTITAAFNPTPNDYLYFLSDKNGNIHYAKTLKEHAANRAKYL